MTSTTKEYKPMTDILTVSFNKIGEHDSGSLLVMREDGDVKHVVKICTGKKAKELYDALVETPIKASRSPVDAF